jgi:hypothetical protein
VGRCGCRNKFTTSSVVFDEHSRVAGGVGAGNDAGGADPLPAVADREGFDQWTADRVGLPNAVPKLATVVAGIYADTDTIDDIDVLRRGGMRALFTGVYAARRRSGPCCGSSVSGTPGIGSRYLPATWWRPDELSDIPTHILGGRQFRRCRRRPATVRESPKATGPCGLYAVGKPSRYAVGNCSVDARACGSVGYLTAQCGTQVTRSLPFIV